MSPLLHDEAVTLFKAIFINDKSVISLKTSYENIVYSKLVYIFYVETSTDFKRFPFPQQKSQTYAR